MIDFKNFTIIFAIFLISLSFVPSYAAVTSVSTDKLFYTLDDDITFIGEEDEGNRIVTVVIRDSSGDYMGNMGGFSDADGIFETIPRAIKDYVAGSGTYNATAFSETEQETEGISILLVYDGNTISVGPGIDLELQEIGPKVVEQGKTLTFIVSVTDPSIDDLEFSLDKNIPAGATIDKTSGKFTWTPSTSQGPGGFIFDVVVNVGPVEDRETITVTVNKPKEVIEPEKNPVDEQKSAYQKIIDSKKGTDYYLGRYTNEPAYQKWFDDNFPDITIYQGLGISDPTKPKPPPEPTKTEPTFVDPKKDPQYYIDRYENEPTYKEWFDTNYPEWTIYEAVGLPNPKTETPTELAPFVDPNLDPQYYVDRYNNEPTYKKWFDTNFPDMTIYQAVGLEEPPVGICGPDTIFIDGVCEGVEPKQSTGGCLIATATYGSELAPQVQQLRELRDNTLMNTDSGSSFLGSFNQLYYTFSPTIADWERENPYFKESVKVILAPLITTLSLLNYADIDSETEVIGYGLGIIFLNLGMYIAAPAIIIWNLRKLK